MTTSRECEVLLEYPKQLSGGTPMDIEGSEEINGDRLASSNDKKPDETKLEYERQSKQFMKDLYKFHENAGTPIVRHPKINGKDVDLFQLYTEMTALGGWVKVNTRDYWDELLETLAFPKSCVNAAVAIKYIYIRYLDRYEKMHFLGEEVERVDEDDEDVRQKKLNTRYLHNVPMTYNNAQHYVSEANRLTHKLSTDYYKPTQNEKLFLSLLSPLPNEQNFALNVCMLISNEPVATFVHLDKCPKLIDALLAHAGVYSHYSLREIFTEFYSNYRKHSLQTFWNDLLSDKPHILELSFGDISESLDGEIVSLDDKESEAAQEAAHHESISSFLNLKRGCGTQDYIGLRVQQIATILRNLSFVEDNTCLFAHSRTFLRFLVMCSNIRWNNLHHMALDMLGNIAEDIELSDPVTDDLSRCLLSTVMDGLESDDRAVIISSMEVLYKLCRSTGNEEYLYRAFDKGMYQQITSFLWLKDAMLVMYTLECMYALTTMGEKTCNGFVHIRGIIDSLVSLVTLEAKTFGQEGCILMCVVDKQQHPGTVPAKPTSTGPAVVVAPAPLPSTPTKTVATPKAPVVVQQNSSSTPQKSNARTVNPSSAAKLLNSKQSQQQAHQENEQNALEWLKSSYESGEVGKDRVDMQELYKLYVTAMSKMKRGGVVSPAFFPKVVKMVFGTTVGPIKDQGTPFYTGIRVKTMTTTAITTPVKPPPPQMTSPRTVTIPTNKPAFSLPPSQSAAATVGATKANTIIQQVTADGTHVITTVAAVQAAAAAAGNPNNAATNPTVVTTTSGITITSQPSGVMVRQLPTQQQQQAGNTASVTTPGAPSSLIKSLLANKVTTSHIQVNQSPVRTVLAGSPAHKQAQFVQETKAPQPPPTAPQKTPFYINPTNSNIATVTPSGAQVTVLQQQPAPPPAGAVAAASVIMSSVAAQGGRASASVPIHNSNKLLQVSPNKALIGHPPLILSSPKSSTNNPSSNVIASNAMNVRQVAQRQQLQKQKELAQRNLMGTHTKPGMNVNPVVDSSQPPPLAPLSSGSAQKLTVVKINRSAEDNTISLANQLDGMTPPTGGDQEDDVESDDGKQSKVTANKMLADLLEKKSDPPTFGEGSSGTAKQTQKGKRKTNTESGSSAPIKKKGGSEPAKATPSAANLYAEMAASILEDDESMAEEEETEEDTSMEEEQVTATHIAAAASGKPQQIITLPLRQQIIMPPGASQQQQVILTGPHPSAGQHPAGTTSIIQQGPMTTAVNAGQTQYVLATNRQGQTYVVATQPPMQQQQKTIIILQQQPNQTQGAVQTAVTPIQQAINSQGQKIIMTTPQGQQVVMTGQGTNLQAATQVLGQSGQRQVVIQQHHQGVVGQGSPTTIMTGGGSAGQVQKQIILSSGLQIKPVHIQATPQPVNVQPQPIATPATTTIQLSQKGVTNTVIQTGVQMKQLPVPAPVDQATIATVPSASPSPHSITITTPLMSSSSSGSSSPVPQSAPSPKVTTSLTTIKPAEAAASTSKPAMALGEVMTPASDNGVDINWPYVCDWRGCPRRKFKSAREVFYHACKTHCPDTMDMDTEFFCQWGMGPHMCDGKPRKRLSLMTHFEDRHCTEEKLMAAVQRRLEKGIATSNLAHPITIIRDVKSDEDQSKNKEDSHNAGETVARKSGKAGTWQPTAEAVSIIKRNEFKGDEFTKAWKDDNEGPVSISIRLTASLILRNLVTYSDVAKRMLKSHETHLSQVALSNVESSRTIAQILYEMNDFHPV